jgi:hypothetical protein
MSGLIIVFLIWCVIAVPVGFAFAKMEQKVNNLPEARTKSAILLSVFLGPIGWIILAARSGMRFAAGTHRRSAQRSPLSGGCGGHPGAARRGVCSAKHPAYLRMFTARATTRIPTTTEIVSSAIIMSFAHGFIAETSVGLNAIEVLKDRCR